MASQTNCSSSTTRMHLWGRAGQGLGIFARLDGSKDHAKAGRTAGWPSGAVDWRMMTSSGIRMVVAWEARWRRFSRINWMALEATRAADRAMVVSLGRQ